MLSLGGARRSVEDTEKWVASNVHAYNVHDEPKKFLAFYAVHKRLDSSPEEPERAEFIGWVSVHSLSEWERNMDIPEHMIAPASSADSTLETSVAYCFLPHAWGQGFATEALLAIFEKCRERRSFWEPYAKVWLRAIVNRDNRASQRVAGKSGLEEKGEITWRGEPVWLGGKWREEDTIKVYGMYLVE